MKAFIIKYIEAILERYYEKYNRERLIEIENNNSKLREEKKSDIIRWAKKRELNKDWNERTAILGEFVVPNASIIEFGAGSMVLKKLLKNYKSYTPSDIVKRNKETIVCDLNETITINLSQYDTAIFSGVLEYVYDIDKVIAQMSISINQIVLSYSCADIVNVSRDKNGWLSDYTKTELEQIFKKYNYKIENYQEWRDQSLYNLIKE